jgi:hypothetical protein
MGKIKLFLFISLMLVSGIESEVFAQCTGLPCQPLNETFGAPTGTCNGQQGAAVAGMVNNCNYSCIGGPAIDDGEYRVSCDGTDFNYGWKGGGAITEITDNTTGSGYFAMINNVADNTEIYHKKVTQLCQGATYNVTFYAANASDYNSADAEDCGYSSENVNLTSYTFPANTAVTAAGAFSAAGATRTLRNTGDIFCTNTTGVVWTAYTQSITITAAEATNGLDLVLISANGNGAGADFVIDDIKITYVSGGSPSGFCTTPVDLLSFTAEKTPQNVLLKWSTAMEKNFSHFVIEKSSDGINYEQAGIVFGSGNSSNQINYTFEDYAIIPGIVYYRLKQVDLDGSVKYSEIRSVNIDNTNPALIYSSNGDLTIQFNAKGEAIYTVVDMLGRTLYSGTRTSDESIITVSRSNFSNGVYIVKVQMGNELVTKKLVLN